MAIDEQNRDGQDNLNQKQRAPEGDHDIENQAAKSEEALPLSKAERQRLKEQSVDAAFMNPENIIIPVELDKEMKQSFIDYAMSVITDRALPDVRDGLKPVHRRILYSMFTQGFTSDKPFRKCATTVGDVLGRFHPHGDASVYDALVRLAQDFSMRHPLVDGHGNFGSRDGDPAAAYRYTEARLTRLSQEMMNNINKDTIDFQPNFDEHHMEPTVLPAGFPNLLVNGSSGIAVGMATNIPPHNLGESIDAAIYLIDNPGATVDELIELMPGPDFPTYGTILGMGGIRQAYKTGRGCIVVRANCDIEEMRGGRYRIVVHDLPYLVNKARLIERIAGLVKERRIEGISDVRDESDRNEEVRIVIELKRDATPEVVLNQLYHHTQLQDNFNCNMLALVPDGTNLVPRVINLPQALGYFLAHERSVVTRRTRFELEKAEARRHIVLGLQMAIDQIDAVIATIRASANENDAREALCRGFGFTEKQAQHVVDMRLGRLSGLEREKLQAEYDELCGRIAWYSEILEDSGKMDGVIKEELEELKRRYDNPRRTQIEPNYNDIDDESLIEEEEVVITLSHAGYVKRLPVDTYAAQHRGGRGITAMQTRDQDYVSTIFTTSTHNLLLIFSNMGRVYKMKAYQIPEAGRQARGTAFVNLLNLNEGEKITGILPLADYQEDDSLIMATKKGLIKRTELSAYANINKGGIIAIALRDEDEMISVALTRKSHQIMLVTQNGMGIRFWSGDVRGTGRNTFGVRGIDLAGDDEVIGMASVEEDAPVLFVTEKGLGKRTYFTEFRLQRRGGKGLIAYRLTGRTGKLVRFCTADDEQDVLLVTDKGIIIRVHAEEIPVLKRATQGVKLMRTGEGSVVDVDVILRDDSEESSELPDNQVETEQEDETGTDGVKEEIDLPGGEA